MKSGSEDKYDLVTAFPPWLQKDAREALSILPRSHLGYSGYETVLMSGHAPSVPNRIYYGERDQSKFASLPCTQQVILHALYTRHHNGHVRENHITALIPQAHEHIWATPYLMLPIGEYVKEILDVIYDNRSSLSKNFIRTFFRENPRLYSTIQSRVVSYWDCYYRKEYPDKQCYVGVQLLDYLTLILN